MPSLVSLRLPDALFKKVQRLAAIEHRTVAEMTRQLVEEAIKLREFPDIVFTEGPTGRRATMRSGLDVWEIIEPYLLAGKDWNELVESYPDTDEGLLRAALRYYEAYPDEIEARIALDTVSEPPLHSRPGPQRPRGRGPELTPSPTADPILALRGVGKDFPAGEDPNA